MGASSFSCLDENATMPLLHKSYDFRIRAAEVVYVGDQIFRVARELKQSGVRRNCPRCASRAIRWRWPVDLATGSRKPM